MKANGLQYNSYVEDGGLTVVFRHDNGKILAKARENCYSEGAAMDLLEVYGLYEDKGRIYGFIDATGAFSMFMRSLKKYMTKIAV